ncbi:MAG TPA: sortase [Chloroflexota bacterium]|nr:sortase [Chloroflexota bacterium]
MHDWLSRFGGFGLIFAGWLLLTGLIPSAAGPADALRGAPLAAPPIVAPPGAPAPPRLISSSRQGPLEALGLLGQQPAPSPTAVPATAVPTAAPVVEATLEVEPALVPEAPAPAPTPLPPGTDRIVLPRIGVDVSVVDVGLRPSGEMETASFAAGRLALSAQAGEAGNAVIAGHNDVEGEVFRRLPEMRPGDDVILYRGDRRYRYTVVVRTIVREEGAAPQQRYENARWMEPTEGATTTLISCYPYRVDTHRVIVHAVMIEGS